MSNVALELISLAQGGDRMTDGELCRFMNRVQPEPMTGCWLWTGGTDSAGYGHMSMAGRVLRTHRISYEHHVGPIRDGYFTCHRCDTPACVNPDHLFLGTASDNNNDKSRKGRARAGRNGGAQNRRKTHCPLGHEFTPENTLQPKGRTHRMCRECGRERSRRMYREGRFGPEYRKALHSRATGAST